ncbi:hypothetical protein TrST_g2279 [Triparma strigata]|uniref:NAD(P)-binding domain-containing protein n=1 Tax=Triparma strigata TaxID=1606541 RepID=A0A9W7EFE0_9STRA|nr:hypothetical protein TrST_g2279 [Triparma strigata]
MIAANILLLLICLFSVSGFQSFTVPHSKISSTSSLLATRGEVIKAAMALPLAILPLTASAAALPSSKPPVVLVLGASGRSGMSTIEACLKRSIPCTSATRTGSDPFKVVKLDKSYYTPYPSPVDVTDLSSLKAVIEAVKPTAIVYAASASKKGGNAQEVDYGGVKNVVEVLPKSTRLVLISALAVDRPDSQGYKMTNSMGGVVDGIMYQKLRGEDEVRKKVKDYVIIRPGVLVNGKDGGPVEIAQGDYLGGGLSRQELAELVVDAVEAPETDFTVEVYRKKTRTALQKEFEGQGSIIESGGSGKERFKGVVKDK